jgi:Leucine-rich repeat (LRR) protein
MALNPKKIYNEFRKSVIDKESAVDSLIYLIENADSIETRLMSIKILLKISSKNDKTFSILENLLISDSNEEIRILAANNLNILFQEKALAPLQWALEHEKSMSWQFILDIVSIINKFTNKNTKKVFVEKIKKFDNDKFTKSLSPLFESGEIHNNDIDDLANIIANYVIIKFFEEILKVVNYEVVNGLVSEIDLSFTSNNNSGWKVLKDLSIFISILKYLRKLELRGNRIGKFPNAVMSLSSLNYLDLSHNVLKNLPDNMLSLNSIEYLDLGFNTLTELPNSIGDLTNLRILDLKNNQLSTLPASIRKLTSLEVLNLHGNQLNNIPAPLESLSALQTLKLGLNSLKIVPEWIHKLKSLKKLGLGGNKSLSSLEWVGFLPGIVNLNLYDNNIKKLPDSIGILTSLEVLKLPNNQILKLPESFKNLSSLKKLDMSWNSLTSLPDWIGSLTSLEELNFRGNKLKSLPNSMGNLISLKFLNLTLNDDFIQIPKSVTDLQNRGLQLDK